MNNGKRRIYLVKDTSMLDAHPPRLIEAVSQAAALKHVCKPFTCSVPDAIRIVDLVTNKGVKVEVAE